MEIDKKENIPIHHRYYLDELWDYNTDIISKFMVQIIENKLFNNLTKLLVNIWKIDDDKVFKVINVMIDYKLMHLFCNIVECDMHFRREGGQDGLRNDILFSHIYIKTMQVFPEKKEILNIITNGILESKKAIQIIKLLYRSTYYTSENNEYHKYLDHLKNKAVPPIRSADNEFK